MDDVLDIRFEHALPTGENFPPGEPNPKTPLGGQPIQRPQVDVSVYGATAETYERVTRVPGSFARFVRGVDLLADRRVPVLLKLVLLTPNVHEHHAMREFARARSLPYQINTEIHPNVDGSLEPLTYRLPPHQAFEVWREESGEKVLQRQMEEPAASPCRPEPSSPGPSSPERSSIDEGACGFAEGVFHCRCGKTSAAVTPYGKLNLCLSIYHPQYDLTNGSLKEGWNQLVDLVNSANPGPTLGLIRFGGRFSYAG